MSTFIISYLNYNFYPEDLKTATIANHFLTVDELLEIIITNFLHFSD